MKLDNIEIEAVFRKYPMNDRWAIELISKEEGIPYAVATVNLPDVELEEDEVIIKNYSENEGILELLEKEGIVKRTGRSVKTGWVTVPVCKILKGIED